MNNYSTPKCISCSSDNAPYFHRPSGKFFCSRCFDHLHTCMKCGKVELNGMRNGKEFYCWDCYLKEWGIKRRKPKTASDFALLKKLSKPIWKH